MKNFGETPATVTDLALVKRLLQGGQLLPVVPEYLPRAEGEPPNCLLVNDDEFFTTINFPMTHEERSDIEESRTHVRYVYGYVDYIDKFGGHHRAGYARCFNGNITGQDNLTIVIQAGYNYDRERQRGYGNDWENPS